MGQMIDISSNTILIYRIRPGLHDIGSLFMPDCFPESGTKNAPDYECLHEAWKASQ